MIPADAWPEWADRHCWDEDGKGWFYGAIACDSMWRPSYEPSNIPMPAGHDWRVPVMWPSAEQPAVDVDWRLRGYAYASKQATTCAGCGEHKHTPLRIDAMGGYVCLTCIDQKLGTLLGEFGYPQPAPAIDQGQYAVAVRYAINGMREAGGITNTKVADKLASLMAQIDGQIERHPDDIAVDAFAEAMKAKLAAARAKGRAGWNGDELGMQQRLSDMLREHVAKGDPVDVANFAMFLHQRGERIDGPAAIDLEQFRHAVEFWRRNCEMPHLETEARRLLALIDGQAGDNSVRVDRGALQMALNVLRRAGKREVADALAGGVTEQPTKGEGEKS